MAEEREVPFGGYPREEIQWRRGGPVAQRIRARGYEPRCRGFESLLAHSLPKGKGLYFPPEGRKTMIGIADPLRLLKQLLDYPFFLPSIMEQNNNNNNGTSQDGNNTSHGATGLIIPSASNQDPWANLLANILGKQQETQQRQMEILERITKSDANRNGLGEFQKLKPPTFSGTANPLEAEEWIVAMEKSFEAMGCTDKEKIIYATYMLQSSAFEWWDAHKKSYSERIFITWELFKEAFYKKYFPESVKRMKEKEFLELKQGNKSVAEYEIEFSRLARFAPEFVQTDGSKARRFESGLRQPLKRRVEAFELTIFREVVSKAQLLEKGEDSVETTLDKCRENLQKIKAENVPYAKVAMFHQFVLIAGEGALSVEKQDILANNHGPNQGKPLANTNTTRGMRSNNSQGGNHARVYNLTKSTAEESNTVVTETSQDEMSEGNDDMQT
ncbi:Os10g0357350 [Oryza sativa Japonica Group]|uniref:Os10g0357350 protein n=1 Tax=Oryza sativa subsp. japonica TaxID=39947 RepID=C7J7N6_ORYSJ|nr:Os10g0357350 [Oryza sativa Japonica Group]|eukprot:NP_001176105.1 Os10g0357350 [Oryza sativa Japonica Group]